MARRRERSLRLRTRVTLFFAAIALFAGMVLIGVTYGFARSNLIADRTASAKQAAFDNADQIAFILDDPDAERREDAISQFFDGELRSEPGGFALLMASPALGARTNDLRRRISDLPTELVDHVEKGGSGTEFIDLDGASFIIVGVYIRRHQSAYFEAFPAGTANTTLRALITALGLGGLGTLVLATLFGYSTSRRLLRPISRFADAAEDIAGGGLDTRLETESDPDLDRLASSFNDMADAVQTRIEREARFASDVSHELRSPITALTAAVEVLDARRDDIPERTQQALDVVVQQVRRFDSMVIDLLELSRLDAGATDLNIETLDIVDLTRRVMARFGAADVPIDVEPAVPREIEIDKVRYERIIGNLIANAEHHGGGAVAVVLTAPRRNAIRIAVDDRGPGVAAGERERIFERYARGSAARHRVGTGLGLALVSEHSAALGGAAWVEDRPGGGARFIAELPTRQDRP